MNSLSLGNIGLLMAAVGMSYLGQVLIKWQLTGLQALEMTDRGQITLFFSQCLGNGYVWAGLGCMGVAFAFWLGLMSRLEFSQAFLMMALANVPAVFVGYYLFGDSLSTARMAGAALIVLGVALVGYSGS